MKESNNSHFSQEEELSRANRRTFLNLLLGGGLLVLLGQILYPIIRYIIPPIIAEPIPISVVAGKISDLIANSGKIFRFGSKAGLLIKTPDGQIRAFNATCTHLQCTVQYSAELKQIWCACHNGHYDLNGINVSGPPPRPLEPYKVILKGNDIIVTKGD